MKRDERRGRFGIAQRVSSERELFTQSIVGVMASSMPGVMDGKFGLRPSQLGPYILTLFRGNEVVGHADVIHGPNHWYPQGIVELDWATRKQMR